MSSVIHYKFKSSKDYDTYKFDGAGVPVWELKDAIVAAKKLGKSMDFDLLITNAQSNEEYKDEVQTIPRNSSVIVRRVPAQKGRPSRNPPGQSYIVEQQPFVNLSLPPPPIYNSQPSASTGGEAERISNMMAESTSHWNRNQDMPSQAQMLQTRRFMPRNMPMFRPPPTYVCYRCGERGHYITHCPTNGDPNFERPRLKRTTGIPKSFLKAIDLDQAIGGADKAGQSGANGQPAAILVTPEGGAVVAPPNEYEWRRLTNSKISPEKTPDELKCTICQLLLTDAVSVPCCEAKFCDECVRTTLTDSSELEGSNFKCPKCKKPLVPDQLISDHKLRQQVQGFLRGEVKNFKEDSPQISSTENTKYKENVNVIDLASHAARPSAFRPPVFRPPFPMPPFPFAMSSGGTQLPFPFPMPPPGFIPPRPHMPFNPSATTNDKLGHGSSQDRDLPRKYELEQARRSTDQPDFDSERRSKSPSGERLESNSQRSKSPYTSSKHEAQDMVGRYPRRREHSRDGRQSSRDQRDSFASSDKRHVSREEQRQDSGRRRSRSPVERDRSNSRHRRSRSERH